MYNCYSMDEKILYIARCEYKYFLNKTNVVGVGLGYKNIGGFCTGRKCIKVLVAKKYSKSQLHSKELIPLRFKGIETDVEEVGIFTMCSLRARIRPVPGGYNVAPTIPGEGGTYGCLVTDGENKYLLSSNHVLANNGITPIGTPIVQPGVKYGGRDPRDTIAHLTKYIPIKCKTPTISPENFVDAAIAKVITDSIVYSQITFLGNIKGTSTAKLGKKVQKVGCSTELTYGRIIDIGVTIVVNLPIGEAIFKNQIITNKMSSSGDSGALLLNSKLEAIGLVMSGSDTTNSNNPIDVVLRELDVNLVY